MRGISRGRLCDDGHANGTRLIAVGDVTFCPVPSHQLDHLVRPFRLCGKVAHRSRGDQLVGFGEVLAQLPLPSAAKARNQNGPAVLGGGERVVVAARHGQHRLVCHVVAVHVGDGLPLS